jgi:hypothetical protein
LAKVHVHTEAQLTEVPRGVESSQSPKLVTSPHLIGEVGVMDRSEAPDNGVDADSSTSAHPPASIVELPDMLEPGDSVVEPTPTPTSVSATDALPTDEAKGPFKGAQETVHTPGESSEADRDSARAHVPRAEANTGAGSAGGAQRGADGDEEGEDADGESEPEEELTEEAIALRLASADAAKLQGNDFFKNSGT